MNERNVEALAYLLEELPVGQRGMPEPVRSDFIKMLAENLARSGVLVPGAMTPADWTTLEGAVMWEYIGLDDLGLAEEANGRAALERIARGE